MNKLENSSESDCKIKAGDIIVFAGDRDKEYIVTVTAENVFLVGLNGVSLLEFYNDIETVGELQHILDTEYSFYSVYSRKQYEIILKEKDKAQGKFYTVK